MIYKTALTFFLLAISLVANSQFVTDQQWIQYSNQVKLKNDFVINSDANIRFQNTFSHFVLYLVRSTVAKEFTENISVAVGFAYAGQVNNNDLIRNEFRPHQEFNLKNKLKFFTLNHRIRVEERFFSSSKKSYFPKQTDFNFRFRYRLLVEAELINFNEEKKLNLLLGNEFFFNPSANKVYEQNRFLIGPEMKFSKKLVFSMVYNYQTSSNTTTHVFWLNIKHSIN